MFKKIWKGIVTVVVFAVGIIAFFLMPDRDNEIDEKIRDKKKDIEKKKTEIKEKKKNIQVGEEEDPVKFLRDFANSDDD